MDVCLWEDSRFKMVWKGFSDSLPHSAVQQGNINIIYQYHQFQIHLTPLKIVTTFKTENKKVKYVIIFALVLNSSVIVNSFNNYNVKHILTKNKNLGHSTKHC